MSEQDWSKVDNCIAWHFIERHADSWAEVGQMMDELVASRVEAAVLAEREACAKVADTFHYKGRDIAAAIRARGNHAG